MNSATIVQKLWNYCNVLRDDGMSYGDYVEQLTYLLFLKMADEQSRPPFKKPSAVPKGFGWDVLVKLDGDDLAGVQQGDDLLVGALVTLHAHGRDRQQDRHRLPDAPVPLRPTQFLDEDRIRAAQQVEIGLGDRAEDAHREPRPWKRMPARSQPMICRTPVAINRRIEAMPAAPRPQTTTWMFSIDLPTTFRALIRPASMTTAALC